MKKMNLNTAPWLRLSLGLLGLCSVPQVCSAQVMIWDLVGDGSPPYPSPAPRIHAFSLIHDVDGDGVRDVLHGSTNQVHQIRSGVDGHTLQRYHGPSPYQIISSYSTTSGFLGDWDGDGVPDYALGAPGDSGVAYYGGLIRIFSGATHQAYLDLSENQTGQYFGKVWQPLGDVDGDGFADLGVFMGMTTGSFHIYGGPDGHLIRIHPFTSELGPRNGAPFVDFNCDGAMDYLVGRRHESSVAYRAGGVDVISGADGSILVTGLGLTAYGNAGFYLSRAGDWNGDGIEDFATSYGRVVPYESGVYIFSGADGSLLRHFVGEDYASPNSGFGKSLASGRDLTGDGVPDLVVGAWEERPSSDIYELWRRGRAFVFSGRTGALVWAVRGAHRKALLGGQVEVIEDHNGDGIDDWVVSSTGYNVGDTSGGDDGRFMIFAGAPAEVESLCSGGVNHVGQTAELWNSGPIGLRTNELVLDVRGLPPMSPGLLAFGIDGPAVPFGAGELCLSGNLTFLTAGSANSSGEVSFPIDLGDAQILAALGGPLQAGDSASFQYLYRDGTQRNTTNALRMTFSD